MAAMWRLVHWMTRHRVTDSDFRAAPPWMRACVWVVTIEITVVVLLLTLWMLTAWGRSPG